MTESVHSLTRMDIDECHWQNVVDVSPNKRCQVYSPHFFEKAAEAKAAGDLKACAVYGLFAAITHPFLRLHGKKSPFEPDHFFPTISDDHLVALLELVAEVPDSEIRTRIADMLWITGTSILWCDWQLMR